MSHFACSVFHRANENPELLLEPYSYEAYEYFEREIYMTKEEYISNYKLWHTDTTLSDEAIWEKRHEEYDDTDDKYIYTSNNPNGQFDWMVAGGRYSASLKVRKSVVQNYKAQTEIPLNIQLCNEWDQSKNRYYTVYSAPVKEVLWDKMSQNKTQYKKLVKDWETNEELRNKYKSKDEYLITNNLFYTWAYYDSDNGEWGCVNDFWSSRGYAEHFVDMINRGIRDDLWITIVDCHS